MLNVVTKLNEIFKKLYDDGKVIDFEYFYDDDEMDALAEDHLHPVTFSEHKIPNFNRNIEPKTDENRIKLYDSRHSKKLQIIFKDLPGILNVELQLDTGSSCLDVKSTDKFQALVDYLNTHEKEFVSKIVENLMKDTRKKLDEPLQELRKQLKSSKFFHASSSSYVSDDEDATTMSSKQTADDKQTTRKLK